MSDKEKAELGLDPEASEELTEQEVQQVEEHAHLRPLAVHEVVRREGVEELARPVPSLWWSGLTAGLSIGFSVVAQGTLMAVLPDAPWRGLLASSGYSVGFLIVILGRYQLFTEITLTAMLPVLAEPSRNAVIALLRLWGVVLAANLAGTFLFAAVLASHAVLPQAQMAGIDKVARHLTEFSALDAFLRAIVSGWLVATLVWLQPSAEAARIWVIALLTGMIAALDLSHVVSGSVEIFYLQMTGALGVADGIVRLLLPLLAGNVIGGAALFALLVHGQVRQELEPEHDWEQPRAPARPRAATRRPPKAKATPRRTRQAE